MIPWLCSCRGAAAQVTRPCVNRLLVCGGVLCRRPSLSTRACCASWSVLYGPTPPSWQALGSWTTACLSVGGTHRTSISCSCSVALTSICLQQTVACLCGFAGQYEPCGVLSQQKADTVGQKTRPLIPLLGPSPRPKYGRWQYAPVHTNQISLVCFPVSPGIDKEHNQLVVAIIDFIRTYTWDKQLETWVKSSGILGGAGASVHSTCRLSVHQPGITAVLCGGGVVWCAVVAESACSAACGC